MSDQPTSEETRESESAPRPEAQHERWIKYGSNVALAIVLAIVLAGVITYIAEARPVRVDTTAAGFNSLKPQTKNLIQNLNQNIKLVSLYEKPEKNNNEEAGAEPTVDEAGMVADLLDNYRRNSKKISVEIIDPTDKNKVDTLINDLYQRYGKDVANYKAFLSEYDAKYKQLTQLTTAESAQMANLANENLPDNEVGQSIQAIFNTIRKIPDNLRDNRSDIDAGLRETHPDYKAITSSIQSALERVSKLEDAITKYFEQHKGDADLSPAVKQYITQSLPRHTEIKKIADDQIARIGKLGELKIDELRRALNTPNPILVLGESDWRILNESQVWTTNAGAQQWAEGKIRPSFAGEQQVTTAIFSLTQSKKPKVAFLRPGGAPLTNPGFPPFQPSGPLSEIAGRMRAYNFDVVEKDLSGQWAMQAQMRQMPAAPEPSWDEINDAIWIIIDAGGAPQGAEPIGTKLAEHLGHGGSALILVNPASGPSAPDAYASVLRDWGIDLHPDLWAVHEQVPAEQGSGTTSDPVQEALRVSYIWDIKDYGTHELAKPLKNLDSVFVPLVVVKTHNEKDRVVTPLIPIPDAPAAPRSWGEKDTEQITRGTPPKFEPDKGDMAGPIYGGAISEKPGAGRLVVIGSVQFMTDNMLDIPNLEIARTQRMFVSRFPGNAELAMNSVFWLAKMDTMIAISPSAMQVSRIANMSVPVLEFWRIGVLLVLLPLLVIFAGVMTWVARRD